MRFDSGTRGHPQFNLDSAMPRGRTDVVRAAKDPVAMARAFALGVGTGFAARQAGLMPKSDAAVATSPLTSFLKTPAYFCKDDHGKTFSFLNLLG